MFYSGHGKENASIGLIDFDYKYVDIVKDILDSANSQIKQNGFDKDEKDF